MTEDKTTFISFENKDGRFTAFISLETAIELNAKANELLQVATQIYETSISKLGKLIAETRIARKEHKPIEAQKVWEIGELIFELKNDLAKLTLEVDGLYDHLVRDLEVKRKWLEKVVIFRRYISEKKKIPSSLNWGRCEKGTRKAAEKIERGLSVE